MLDPLTATLTTGNKILSMDIIIFIGNEILSVTYLQHFLFRQHSRPNNAPQPRYHLIPETWRRVTLFSIRNFADMTTFRILGGAIIQLSGWVSYNHKGFEGGRRSEGRENAMFALKLKEADKSQRMQATTGSWKGSLPGNFGEEPSPVDLF